MPTCLTWGAGIETMSRNCTLCFRGAVCFCFSLCGVLLPLLPAHLWAPGALARRDWGGQCVQQPGGNVPSLWPCLFSGWAVRAGWQGGWNTPPRPRVSVIIRRAREHPVTVILFVTFSLVVSKLIRLGIYSQRLARLHRVESRIDLRGWWWDLGNVSVPSRVYKSALIPARFSLVQ